MAAPKFTMKPSNTYIGALDIPPLPRAKYGTAKHRLTVRMSTTDHEAYRKLEDGAHAFAGVNGTAVIKRAIRFYNAHLLSIRHDESAMAHEVIELRRGTYAA
jgi:hypothetical protein